LKESGSATALLIDPSDEGIRKAEIQMPAFVRVGDHLSGAVDKHYAVNRGESANFPQPDLTG